MKIFRVFALYHVKIKALKFLGYFPYFTVANPAMVNFQDRAYVGGSAS